jgi:hypothetical protein
MTTGTAAEAARDVFAYYHGPGFQSTTCAPAEAINALQAFGGVFKTGLRGFVSSEHGSFGARRVTLRQEKYFPSDQEFAVRFGSLRDFYLEFDLVEDSTTSLEPYCPISHAGIGCSAVGE